MSMQTKEAIIGFIVLFLILFVVITAVIFGEKTWEQHCKRFGGEWVLKPSTHCVTKTTKGE